MDDASKNQSPPPPPPGPDPGQAWTLTLSPRERKLIIALAVSGEPEKLDTLADSTDLDPRELAAALAELAAKGIVALVKDAPAPVAPPAAAESPRDIIEDAEHAPAPAESAPPPLDLEALKSYLESRKDLNYYQMLGVGPRAVGRQIRTAYYELVAEYHPDRHRDCPDPAVLAVLAEIFGLLTSAYENLFNPKRRHLYDRTIPSFTGVAESEEEEALAALFEESQVDQPPADGHADKPLGWNFYQAAVEAFQSGDYQTADLNFKLATGMEPERPEYREGLAKTREIITAGMLEELKREARSLEDQRKFPEAVVALAKAVELDPVDPDLRYALARLRFLKTLDRLRAEEDVSWAVSLDPNHIEALLLMGRIQAWKGNTPAAITTFRQVLKIVPGHAKAKQALALFEK
jgi:curved DNA-binding protein CbpA